MYKLHDVEWTEESVSRFWDYYGSRKEEQTSYCANLIGDLIVDFAKKKKVPVKGKILDYGCGPGFLMKYLFKDKNEVYGLDVSPETVKIVNDKYKDNQYFKKCVLSTEVNRLMDEKFNIIFFLDAIEHVIPSTLDGIVSNMFKLLDSGGHVIVTTVNNEDLGRSYISCPDCGCIFHKVQHMSSWNVDKIKTFFEKFGFKTICAEPVYFGRKEFIYRVFELARKIVGKTPPKDKLVYIGVKP